MFDLITIGDCTIDIFHLLEDHEIEVVCQLNTQACQLCMTYADKIPVKEIHTLVAGNAANNAVGATRLGLKTALYTVLGDDDRGELIRAKLSQEGVAADYFIIERGSQSNYSTVLSYRGERTILVYHVPRRYHLPRLAPARWVYLTSMAQGSEQIFSDLIDYLAQNHAQLIYQPGTFQLRFGRKASAELLRVTAGMIMNKEEAIRYLECSPATPPQDLIHGLFGLGPKWAVITDAEHGSYAGQGGTVWRLGIHPHVPRREMTGAGDAYATGLVAAFMLGRELPEAMVWGTLNAESVIQQIGPQAGLLSREAIEFQVNREPDFIGQPI